MDQSRGKCGLKSFSRRKGQGQIHSLARQIRGLALLFTPLPGKGRDTVIGTAIAQAYQINMHLSDAAAVLAAQKTLALKPAPQRCLIGIKLARRLSLRVARFNIPARQLLANCVARQLRVSDNLSNGNPISEMPTPNYTQ